MCVTAGGAKRHPRITDSTTMRNLEEVQAYSRIRPFRGRSAGESRVPQVAPHTTWRLNEGFLTLSP